MRVEPVEISETEELKLDIMDLPLNFALIISEGKAKLVELHPHAETKILTYKEKVSRVKFEVGEDF